MEELLLSRRVRVTPSLLLILMSMKILVTGVNPVQCGHVPKVSYVSSIQCIRGTLKEMGHDVECKPVKTTDSLAEYDKIIVYAAPMTGFVGKYALPVMNILFKAITGQIGDKVVVSYDDWQIETILISIKSLVSRLEKVAGLNQFGWAENEVVTSNLTAWNNVILTLAQGNWDLPSLAPLWPGGDYEKLKLPTNTEKLIPYCPNAYFRNRYLTNFSSVDKTYNHWVLAALHDHSRWVKKLGVEWPVEQYGKKKVGFPKLQELDIFGKYKLSSGVLSPTYKHAGSGWWRARYGFAADLLKPIAGYPKEASFLGEAYAVTPRDVELMTDSEREELAEYQNLAYYSKPDNVVSSLDYALTGI